VSIHEDEDLMQSPCFPVKIHFTVQRVCAIMMRIIHAHELALQFVCACQSQAALLGGAFFILWLGQALEKMEAISKHLVL
jgi:hypothetical protein